MTVELSHRLNFETRNTMNIKPKTFISASAIGIYDQSNSKEKINEESLKKKLGS